MLGNFKLFLSEDEKNWYARNRQSIIQDLMDKICVMETQQRVKRAATPIDKRDSVEFKEWERGVNDALRVMVACLDDPSYVPNKAQWHWDPKHNFTVSVFSYLFDLMLPKVSKK